MTLALLTLGIALTVPGLVTAVRALPWVSEKVVAGVKPWSCDICMTFWGTALVTVVAATATLDGYVILLAGPAYTVALVVLERVLHAPPPGPPPEDLPPLH